MKKIFTATLLLIATVLNIRAQTYTTIANGNFTAGSTWSGGSAPSTPTTDYHNVTITNTVTMNLNLTIGNSGETTTISGALVQPGNTDSLTLAGSTINVSGLINLQGCLFIPDNGAALTITSTGTVIVGCLYNAAKITVNAGGQLIVNGNVGMSQGGTLVDNGTVTVTGNYNAINGSDVTGTTGSLTVNGTATTSGGSAVFGGSGTCTGCGYSSGNPLPINLGYFAATMCGTNACLQWQTITEVNNSYFSIQKSIDGESFTNMPTLSQIPSKAVHGNSLEPIIYQATDDELGSTTQYIYYRLSQTDYNGKATTFNIVPLQADASKQSLHVYPNPATTSLFISTEKGTIVYMYDVLGNEVLQQIYSGNALNISTLPDGVYFIRAGNSTQKFLKQEGSY